MWEGSSIRNNPELICDKHIPKIHFFSFVTNYILPLAMIF